MRESLKDYYDTVEKVVDAPIEELAAKLLRVLVSRKPKLDDVESNAQLIGSLREEYGSEAIFLPCSEAWDWLQRNGLLCYSPAQHGNWMYITRLGRKLASEAELGKWFAERELPNEYLHPSLQGLPLSLYRQGHYDTAVFEAFKLLEVTMREQAKLPDAHIGTKLASKAFNPEDGALTDVNAEQGEKTALMNLMAGAIGSYKNPQSHRRVGVDATDAREMLILASHLLKIVMSRGSQSIE